MSFVDRINGVSDNNNVRKAWLGLAVAVFVCIILVPSMFVVTKLFTEWGLVSDVLGSDQMSVILGAVWNSFSLAILVTVVDIIVGLPIAWIMVRRDFGGKKLLDTLLDLPLAFPTAVLGLSVLMFWGAPEGVTIPSLGLGIGPYAMLILLHFIFTYPYMVRSLSAILEQIDSSYETAAMTLGASRFTAVRTITLPLFRAGLVTGFILCFSRSLSETGGTLIALVLMKVDTTFFTGPTYISAHGGDMGPMILISVIMIAIALLLLVVVKLLVTKFHIKWDRILPDLGRKLSRGLVPKAKDISAIVFLFLVILIPSFYIFAYLAEPASIETGELLGSIGMSFLVAGAAVAFDIIFGIPVAMYIARHKKEKAAGIVDTLVNIPLLVPTTALGFSLTLFWGAAHGSGPYAVALVILGHIAFTYPLVVRNITGAVEEVDPSYEETAMTLGAKPFQAFYKILLPVIKSSVIAGGILAFTRSLGETGATIAIAPDVRTVPCYIVELVKAGHTHYAEAAMCSIVLIAICFVFLVVVRVLTKGKEARHD